MKVFVSSVIRGLEAFRDVAAKAARTLRHGVKRSEDFGASPDSPQRVCLAGVRECDVTVLILGAAYGQPQGRDELSATHEEYREARERRDVLVFIQDGVTRERKQEEFVREVQSWARGHFTTSFSSPEELQEAVTRALHDLTVSRSVGPADESEIQQRAQALVPHEGRGQAPALVLTVSGGPKQAVLRPAELEASELADRIIQHALFGSDRIFDRTSGTLVAIEKDALRIRQDDASIVLTPLGDVRIVQRGYAEREGRGHTLPALIEEDVEARILVALRFSAWLLDHVDSNRRLQTVVPMITIVDARYAGWKTRREHEAEPGRVVMNTSGEPVAAVLAPVSRPRPALSLQAEAIANDFTVLLRRQVRRT